MLKACLLVIGVIIGFSSTSLSQSDSLLSITLRTGEMLIFDKVQISGSKVVGVKNDAKSTYPKKDCKYAVLGNTKNGTVSVKGHVAFAAFKTTMNMGGKGPFEPGGTKFNIVAKNGDHLILKKLEGSGMAGMGTLEEDFYLVYNGEVEYINPPKLRKSEFISLIVSTFGICPEMSKELQDFQSNGGKMLKYTFFFRKLEKIYLANCVNP
jgi:hypothetical protein